MKSTTGKHREFRVQKSPISDEGKKRLIHSVMICLGFFFLIRGGLLVKETDFGLLITGIALILINFFCLLPKRKHDPPVVIVKKTQDGLIAKLGKEAFSLTAREIYVREFLKAARDADAIISNIPVLTLFGVGGAPYATNKVFVDFCSPDEQGKTRFSVSITNENYWSTCIVGLDERTRNKIQEVFSGHSMKKLNIDIEVYSLGSFSSDELPSILEKFFRQALQLHEAYRLQAFVTFRVPVWTYKWMVEGEK